MTPAISSCACPFHHRVEPSFWVCCSRPAASAFASGDGGKEGICCRTLPAYGVCLLLPLCLRCWLAWPLFKTGRRLSTAGAGAAGVPVFAAHRSCAGAASGGGCAAPACHASSFCCTLFFLSGDRTCLCSGSPFLCPLPHAYAMPPSSAHAQRLLRSSRRGGQVNGCVAQQTACLRADLVERRRVRGEGLLRDCSCYS